MLTVMIEPTGTETGPLDPSIWKDIDPTVVVTVIVALAAVTVKPSFGKNLTS
jgi:hypothetical protein